MESLSIWHWIIVLLAIAVALVPFWKICVKAGFSGWLSIFFLVPIINLVALWVLAFSTWPNNKDKAGVVANT